MTEIPMAQTHSLDGLTALRSIRLAGTTVDGTVVFDHETPRQALAGLDPQVAWAEWSLIARSPRPSFALAALYAGGWDASYPELAAVRDVEQDPTWHPEGAVHVHLGLAADAAVTIADRMELTGQDREVLVLAAMLHDLGKATHSQHRPDGRITAYGHAEAGARPVRTFLERIGAPEAVIAQVVPIVREHMAPASTDRVSARAVRRLAQRLAGPAGEGPSLTMWAALVEADNAGRGTGSRPSPARAWLRAAGVTNS